MRWSRGEKIAFWTFLVAVLSCPLVYKLPVVQALLDDHEVVDEVGETTMTPLPSSASDSERKAWERMMAEKEEAARERTLELNRQRIEERKERIEEISGRLRAGGESYYEIFLRNDCGSKKIFVAVNYLDLIGDWTTRGWWGVEPGDTVKTPVKTKNAIVYFYAEGEGGGRWQGVGEDGAIVLDATDAPFYHLNNDPFEYSEPRQETFFRRDLREYSTASGYYEFTQNFTCN